MENPDLINPENKINGDKERIRNLSNIELAVFLLRWVARRYDIGGVNIGRSTRSNLLDFVLHLLPSNEQIDQMLNYQEESRVPYSIGLEEAKKRIKQSRISEGQIEMDFPLNSPRDLSNERLSYELLNALVGEQEMVDRRGDIKGVHSTSEESRLIESAYMLLPHFDEHPFSSLDLMQEAKAREDAEISKRVDERFV